MENFVRIADYHAYINILKANVSKLSSAEDLDSMYKSVSDMGIEIPADSRKTIEMFLTEILGDTISQGPHRQHDNAFLNEMIVVLSTLAETIGHINAKVSEEQMNERRERETTRAIEDKLAGFTTMPKGAKSISQELLEATDNIKTVAEAVAVAVGDRFATITPAVLPPPVISEDTIKTAVGNTTRINEEKLDAIIQTLEANKGENERIMTQMKDELEQRLTLQQEPHPAEAIGAVRGQQQQPSSLPPPPPGGGRQQSPPRDGGGGAGGGRPSDGGGGAGGSRPCNDCVENVFRDTMGKVRVGMGSLTQKVKEALRVLSSSCGPMENAKVNEVKRLIREFSDEYKRIEPTVQVQRFNDTVVGKCGADALEGTSTRSLPPK
ncbi:hypothetical protein Pcinc_020684 [Petrolisthes cinctipes]|uniref:Uncharacterized protein n=1 Tax=Petrolisthes cinctipes TaxID=88211 RepID=A0AAE1KIT7_PETCI|nr:hypothetical protein Pcinc_020684 [Petrolisthes cinctipes]